MMLARAEPAISITNQIPSAPTLGAPFWTVLGVVAGAIITGCFLLWNERRKREAEAITKDRELELKACVEFLSQVAEFYSDESVAVEQCISATSAKLFYVQVLADKDVYILASKLFHATMDFRHGSEMRTAGGLVDDDEFSALIDWYHYQQRLYVNALRRKYGLDLLDVPTEPIGTLPDLDKIAAAARLNPTATPSSP